MAVTLPPALQQRLADAAAPLREVARGVSWVNTANYHLTVKFLGDIAAARAPDIAAALGAGIAAIAEFDITLRGFGAFPGPTRPRVIWVGVADGAPQLAEVAEAVERSLVPLGLSPEARGFSAHMTLGRVREPRRDPALAEALGRATDVELGATRIDRVVLMRSELSPRGARYSELASLPLRRSG